MVILLIVRAAEPVLVRVMGREVLAVPVGWCPKS
jgi:hypothetical protein